MPHISKRRKAFAKKVDHTKSYPALDAMKLVKETATAKFDEAVDVAVNLGIDAKKGDLLWRYKRAKPYADIEAPTPIYSDNHVFITGWATDLCVDATVRSAVSNHHNVVVVTDGHTVNDRPHLDAASVIRHHNWVWSHLITQRSIRLARTDELVL